MKLHLEDGSNAIFMASADVADAAAQYFRQFVYATVTFEHQGGKVEPGQILEISSVGAEENIRVSFEQIRTSLGDSGIKVTSEWLKD